MSDEVRLSRRTWIALAAAGGAGALGLKFLLDAPEATTDASPSTDPASGSELAVWVRIATDGRIEVTVPKAEVGQGVFTTCAAIVAEEMGAELSQVVPTLAGANPAYNDPHIGHQTTGRSASMENFYLRLRIVGARVGVLLRSAAASRWSVDASECVASGGRVEHPETGHSAEFGELLEAALRLPVPEWVDLKPVAEHTILGRSQPRADSLGKANGTALYAIDVSVPGMCVAQLVRSPTFGGQVARVDDTQARAVPGVLAVERLGAPLHAVAVVAESFWAADRGRRALRVEWDRGAFEAADDETVRDALLDDTQFLPASVYPTEDAVARFAIAVEGSDEVVERTYESGYFTHAPMQPPAAVAHVHDGRCEIWAGQQNITRMIARVARAAGVPRDRVTLNPTFLGGSFGRYYEDDVVIEATTLSRRLGRPVKVMWTRTDDLRHGTFHPASTARIAVGTRRGARIDGWKVELRTLSPLAHARNGIAAVRAYEIGALASVHYRTPEQGDLYGRGEPRVTPGALRGVGALHTTFARESMLDELAHREGTGPWEYRRALLSDTRAAALLEASEPAWRAPVPTGAARGIALNRYRGYRTDTWVVAIAEVTRLAESTQVTRLVFHIDCGRVLDPNNARAAVECGAVYALSTIVEQEIHIRDGGVTARNFDDYPPLRIDRVPDIEVVFAETDDERPRGVGELSTTVLAPAVANAHFALTNERLRRLPLFPSV